MQTSLPHVAWSLSRVLDPHQRLRWLDNVARMPDERLPKRLMFASLQQPEAGRPSSQA